MQAEVKDRMSGQGVAGASRTREEASVATVEWGRGERKEMRTERPPKG